MDYSKEISNTFNYIESHLEDNLSLESISKSSFFSQYHYHRVFLNDVGTSIMNYVRTRRICRASYQLLLTDESITDIAFNSGFESIDTFTRAFKRFYGITPSEYRTNRAKKSNYIQQEVVCMSEQKIIDMLELCNVEEKRYCLGALEKMIDLSRKAHKHGLLFLESEVNPEQSLFLNKGLELLLVGAKPENLKVILWNYINVGTYSSREVLERIIILNGLLLIQAGEYPWMIREYLSSFFGESFLSEINEWHGSSVNMNKSVTEFKAAIIGNNPFANETALLEKDVKNMDTRSIQRLVRELDIIVLAVAMKGASGEVKSRLLEGLSKSNQLILLEASRLLSDISIAQMVDSQNEVLKVIKSLRLSNDIK